jgi:hypothetical protein
MRQTRSIWSACMRQTHLERMHMRQTRSIRSACMRQTHLQRMHAADAQHHLRQRSWQVLKGLKVANKSLDTALRPQHALPLVSRPRAEVLEEDVRHCPKRRNAQLQPASAWQVDSALVRRQACDAPGGQRLQCLRCQYLHFCTSKASKLST